MKRKNLFNLLIVLGIALTLTCGVVIASRVQAQEPVPGLQEVLAPQFAVDTAFTYQGRLIQNDSPISDTCDFEFTLYDDNQLSPAQVAGPVTQTNVWVRDGYFATDVDFGSDAFTGEGHQLGIAVSCPAGSGDYTDLSGLVMLHAAPYAHSLRPGAVISSSGTALNLSTSATSGSALGASASASSGDAAAVYGTSSSPDGAGLSGYNSSSGYGVYGGAGGSTGTPYGVYGLASDAGSATSYGVYGKSNSSVGTGVGGEAPMNGVYGKATNSDGYGVYGEATAGSGTTYGVYGRNASNSGAGVYGTSSHATGTGVRGYSANGPGVEGSSDSGNGVVGSSTTGNGVWGYSTNGHAIWSEGDTHINGNLTWVTRTSYIAVSAAAFVPQEETYDYTNQGYQLGTSTTDSEYYAHVQLPHGSRVISMTFYWYDVFGGLIDASCKLYRNDMANNTEQQMAEVWSFGDGGDGSSNTSSVTYPDIDNQRYSYYLEWVLDSSLRGYGVVITYEYTEPY